MIEKSEICPHCGKETPAGQNYCVWCNGALKFTARFRSFGARAKYAPTRVRASTSQFKEKAKAGAGEFKEKARTKALAWIGGKPREDPEEEVIEEEQVREIPVKEKEEKEQTRLAKFKEKALMRESSLASGWKQAGEEHRAKIAEAGHKTGYFFRHLLLILIVLGILYLVYIFFIAPSVEGTYIGGVIGSEGVETKVGLMNAFRPAKGHLSNMWQTITVGPGQQWDSGEISSELVVNDGAGVVIHDLGAPVDFFTGDPIRISGTLDAISTFADENVMLTLGIDPDPLATAPELAHDWTCELFGFEGENSFTVTSISDTRFTCTHPPLGTSDLLKMPLRTFEVTFKLIHNTRAKVSKNLFVTDTASYIGNPADRFKITADQTKAHVASDGKTIDLSMGLARVSKKDFLTSVFSSGNPSDSFLPAVENEPTSTYRQDLGIAFKSGDFSNQLSINSLTLVLPAKHVTAVSTGSQFRKTGQTYVAGNQYPKLQHYELSESYLREYLRPLEVGKSEVVYLNFYVDDEYLGGAPYQTLTALADIDYNYIYIETIPVTLKLRAGTAQRL